MYTETPKKAKKKPPSKKKEEKSEYINVNGGCKKVRKKCESESPPFSHTNNFKNFLFSLEQKAHSRVATLIQPSFQKGNWWQCSFLSFRVLVTVQILVLKTRIPQFWLFKKKKKSEIRDFPKKNFFSQGPEGSSVPTHPPSSPTSSYRARIRNRRS